MNLNKLNLPESTFEYNGREYVYCIDQKSDIKTSLINLIKPCIIMPNDNHSVITIFNNTSKTILIKLGSQVSKESYTMEIKPKESYQSNGNGFNGEITAIIK